MEQTLIGFMLFLVLPYLIASSIALSSGGLRRWGRMHLWLVVAMSAAIILAYPQWQPGSPSLMYLTGRWTPLCIIVACILSALLSYLEGRATSQANGQQHQTHSRDAFTDVSLSAFEDVQMKIDTSRDRPLRFDEPKRRGRAIIAVFLTLLLLGAGIIYWELSSYYAEVYAELNIPSLPLTVVVQPQFYNPLTQLRREPCYQDAAVGLSDALLDAGYPRESAASLLAFAKRCGITNSQTILARAYDAFKKAGDLHAALNIIDQLVGDDPADAEYRYSRGATYEQLGAFSKALTDYIGALQLLGTPYDIAGSQFYDISRMYAALGRYCDAISPIETFISYDPIERRTPQTTELISEYANKGSCETHYVHGIGQLRFADPTAGVQTIPVIVNGTTGLFVLDTGSSYVSVTPDYSAKAGITIEAPNQLTLQTAGGTGIADLGYANTVSVGGAEAQGVAVAVTRGSKDPFGASVDGLLGMSFLARFNLQVSQDEMVLTPIPLH